MPASPHPVPGEVSSAPLRVGIIGTGGISRAHAPAWTRPGIELHAFSLAGAAEFAEATGAQIHDSLEDLLDAVDVVDVCTPTPDHPATVRAALEAGCHVICEKPLARTAADARALAELAAARDRRLLPAHVVRYFPAYAAARRAVCEGAIGTPAVLRFERTGQMPTQPWFADEDASGGIVMDQMIHDLDQALWLAGPARSVYAVQSLSATGTVRTAHAVLEHTAGAISHCRGLWGAPGTAFRTTFSLAGDRGRLEHDSLAHPGVQLERPASSAGPEADYLPDLGSGPSPYVLELADFQAAITGGGPAGVDAGAGVQAVAVAEAALASIRTGRRIPC